MTANEIRMFIEDQKVDYGMVWSDLDFIEIFNISLPDVSSHNRNEILSNVKKFELEKMNAYLSVNEQLLSLGMCIIKDKGNYRVPLVSEISEHINKYYSSSNRKFKRAEKLRNSFSNKFPVQAKEVNNTMNRVASMRDVESKRYVPLKE